MVTVCMPLYNAENFVKKSIESILNQTYSDFELLIVDNCSTDSSVEVVEQIHDDRIVLIKNKENKGLSYSRNKMIELAKGEYIALLDSDDLATPWRLEKEVAFLDSHKSMVAVGGYATCIDEKGDTFDMLRPQLKNPQYIRAYMMLNNVIPNGSGMYRKSVVLNHGIRYQDGYCGVEDYKFWCDLLKVGDIANLGDILLNYRIVSSGVSGENTRKHKKERDEIIWSIQKENLEYYGFQFTPEQLDLLKKCFAENGKPESKEELNKLFTVLKDMERQAVISKLDNANEIKVMCRKRFGEMVSKSMFLW